MRMMARAPRLESELVGGMWSRIWGANEARSGASGRGVYSLEQLEPRFLLSADLLKVEPAVGQSLPFDEQAICIDLDQEQVDLHSQLQIVTTLAMATEQPDETGVDSQVGGEDLLSPEMQPAAEVVQPAPTDDPLGVEANPDSGLSTVSPGQAACTVETECSGSGTTLQAETVGPVVGDPQEIIRTSDTSSIDIRGPPPEDGSALTAEFAALALETVAGLGTADPSASGSEACTNPSLRGLYLVDPEADSLGGQVVYLDFDGARGVTYQGPVTEDRIEVPAFSAPGAFAGQEETIITQTIERLCRIFAGSGIQFTTTEPDSAATYSTIYIGGGDSPFAQYGSFLGLAEQVDVGNRDRADNAFVFSELLPPTAGTVSEYADLLADVVAHEAGHLLGFAHATVLDGGTPLSAVAEEITPERPLIFIPGFAGTLAADESAAGFQEWLLNPGLAPDKLALEPLERSYDNIVQSFKNIGYTEGTDFFVALWDWRVPVALDVSAYNGDTPAEVFDGRLTTVTASDLRNSFLDGRFDSGLSYLAYWIDQAVTAWTGSHGTAPDSVDIVTHSTGGLVARSYIQSAAYGTDGLPEVHNLVQVGVPNEGVSSTYNFLQNDFSQKLASRVLGLLVGQAFELIESGESVNLPDGTTTIAQADLDAQVDPETWFIRQYVGTLQDLLPTYDQAIDSGSGWRALSEAFDGIENKLLLDLNNYGSADPNAWVDRVQGTTTIVYGTQEDTEDRILPRVGADLLLDLDNELLPFGRYIGDWPGDTQSWYQDTESNPDGPEGDGTVPAASAAGLFENDSRVGTKLQLIEIGTAASPVEHTGLANDVSAQQEIIKAVTGIVRDPAYISTGRELGNLDAGLKLLDLGIVSPIGFVKELAGRLPSLVLDVGGTARGQLGQVLNFALHSLRELVLGLLNGEQPLEWTADRIPGMGDVILRCDASALEVEADLDISIGDFFHARGRLILRKPLDIEMVDVATGLPAMPVEEAAAVLGLLEGIIPVPSDEHPLDPHDLQFAPDYSMIRNLPVTTVEIVAEDLTAFAGLNGPYWNDTNGNGIFEEGEADPDAAGLSLTDVDLAFVLSVPLIPKVPIFYTLDATAGGAGWVGLEGILQSSAWGIHVEVNNSTGWPGLPFTPVIDFSASYPAETDGGDGSFDPVDDLDGDGKQDPAGLEVRTGETTDPIYIDFDGKRWLGASADSVLLQLSQFVYVEGSFSFEMGPTVSVDVATNLPGDFIARIDALGDLIDPDVGEMLRNLGTTIEGLQVKTLQVGASDVQAFVGLGPYWYDIDADGVLEQTELDGPPNEGAIGLAVDDLDFGFVMMTPTLAALPGLKGKLPKFYALKASAQSVRFVGLGDITWSLEGINIAINDGKPWLGIEKIGTPIVNFQASFPEGTTDTDGDGVLDPAGFAVRTGTTTDPVYIDFDGMQRIGASVEKASVQISQFVHITGSLAFEKGPVYTVATGGGLLGDMVDDAQELLDRFGLSDAPIPVLDPEIELGFMTVGASNVHAFVGINGPYWNDADGDGVIDRDPLTHKIVPDEVNSEAVGLVIDDFDFGMAIMKPTNPLDPGRYFALRASAEMVSLAGIEDAVLQAEKLLVEVNQSRPSVYGVSLFPVVDFTSEFLDEQMGLFNVDGDAYDEITVGELRGLSGQDAFPGLYDVTALDADVVGLEQIVQTLDADGDGVLEVAEVAQMAGTTAAEAADLDGDGRLAFASKWPNEQMALFSIDDDPNQEITVGELRALSGQSAFAGVYQDTALDTEVVNVERLLQALDTNGNGMLEVAEAAQMVGTTAAEAADLDGDGKLDPAGFEVATGGEPVYLAMDSSLVRAQGFVELDILGSVILTGSIAFELGPTQQVTLTDSTAKTVSTMTIGAANVTAFIGANGPYWTDTNGNHSVDSDELNSNSIGFHITDLDVGLMLMASVNTSDPGVYLAAKASVESFGVVGVDVLDATGRFDIALNVGIGRDSGVAVVDFDASFNEQLDLFDADDDGIVTVGELRALAGQASNGEYAGLYSSTDEDTREVSLALVASVLDTAGEDDGLLQVSEAQAFLSNDSLAGTADADRDGKLDVGFEVHTSDSTSPVVLDFTQFLISLQLGGIVTIFTDSSQSTPVLKLNGLLLFDADPTGLRAFVAAGLEFGPDIGAPSSDKLFDMNALGGLVINAGGIAADIDVSISVGGALRSVLAFNAKARLLFNTTGADQTITIPARYVAFLDGTVDLAGSAIESELIEQGVMNITALSSLTGTLDERFTLNADGSATFTICGCAPRLDGTLEEPGPYFLVSLHGDLTIASAFVITADFHLKISGEGLDLRFDGKLDLSIFGNLEVTGGAVIENGVFAAYVDLGVNVISGVPGINIGGDFALEINTGSAGKTVNGHPVSPNTYRVVIAAEVDLFGVFDANGNIAICAVDGILAIDCSGISIDFFGIVQIGISGYIRSNGSFNLSGGFNLNLTVGSGLTEFGINGGMTVTIKNTGISGQGSAALVVLGQDINIASADLSVDWQAGTFRIRAEGPLGVWLEVVGDAHRWTMDGGLGVFDAVIDAIGGAAEAVGEAVVEAAEAVSDAFEEVGYSILDFGSDVIDFVGGLVTDIGELFGDVYNEMSSWFDDSYTEVLPLSVDPLAHYSYFASESAGVLTIQNSTSSKLCLAIVGDDLIVDAPDVTCSVPVALKQYYTREFEWWGPIPLGWSDWSLTSSAYIYRNVTFSNMRSFAASSVSTIVIQGAEIGETIIVDPRSITVDTEIYGNGGNDVIVGSSGNNVIYGGSGNDTICTGSGNDTVYGEDGDDRLLSGSGNDVLDGGAGHDLLDESYDRASADPVPSETNTLRGGPGDDQIIGSPGTDTIKGEEGNDLLMGSSDVEIIGGDGNDCIIYNGIGTATLYGDNADGTGFGADVLDVSGTPALIREVRGGPGNDILRNNTSADIPLYGEDGDDIIIGGRGGDSILDGGAGNDRIEGRGGRDTVVGGEGDDTFVSKIADLVLMEVFDGGEGDDGIQITGDSSKQDFRVAAVDENQIEVGSYGSTGSKLACVTGTSIESLSLNGEAGADTFHLDGPLPSVGEQVLSVTLDLGAGGSDLVTLTLGSGADDVTLTSSATVPAEGEEPVEVLQATWTGQYKLDILGASEADGDALTIEAGAGDDSITVESSIGDLLTVYGAAGDDRLQTVYRNVQFLGGDDYDTLTVQHDPSVSGRPSLRLDDDNVTVYRNEALEELIGYSQVEAFVLDISKAPDGSDLRVQNTITGPVTITGGDQGQDDFVIEALSGPTTVNLSGDENTVELGRAGSLQFLENDLTINGNASTDHLILDNSADPTDHLGTELITLGPSTLSGSPLPAAITVSYEGVETVELRLGAGRDNVVVPELAREIVVTGGAGVDTATATLVEGSPVGRLTTYDVETVVLTDERTGGTADWRLDGDGLHTGGVAVLATTNADTSTIQLSRYDDSITVSGVTHKTHIETRGGADTVRVGWPDTGGQLDTIVEAPLILIGVAGDDTLTLDDTSRQDSTTGTFQAGSITEFGMGASRIDYVDFASLAFQGSDFKDSASGYDLTVKGTDADTTLMLGAVADTVIVEGTSTFHPTTIRTGGGANSVIVHAAGGLLTIEGGTEGDTLTYAPPASAAGDLSLTGDGVKQGQITCGGPGSVQFTDMETIVFELPDSNGALTLDYTFSGAPVQINGHGGNDTLVAKHLGGTASFAGGNGSDILKLDMHSTTPSSFQNLTIEPVLELLIIDNSNYDPGDGTGVHWIAATDGVFVERTGMDPLLIIDNAAATETRILAGTSGDDTLTVEESADRQVDATLNGNRIELISGAQVLSPGDFINGGYTATYGTLAGVADVATCGDFVYAACAGDDTVAVFKQLAGDGLQLVQVLKDGCDGVETLGGASHIVVSDDGRFVYVSAPDDNAITVFSRNADTGKLSLLQTVTDGQSSVDGLAGVTDLALTDGDLYAVGSADNALAVFTCLSDGRLAFREAIRNAPSANVALGKTATQSSDYLGWWFVTADRAVDGNTDPVFHFNNEDGYNSISHTGDFADSWWEVDLGGDYNLERIKLYDRAGYPDQLTNFFVTVYHDGVEVFRQYVDRVSDLGGGSLDIHLPVGTTGDRVRLQLNGGTVDGNASLVLAECEVYDRGVYGLTGINSVTVSEDGARVYTTGSGGAVSVFSRNVSGELTYVADVLAAGVPTDAAEVVRGSRRILYVTAAGSPTVQAFDVTLGGAAGQAVISLIAAAGPDLGILEAIQTGADADLLLWDSFEDGDLVGWLAAPASEEGQYLVPSYWSIVGGALIQSSNIYGDRTTSPTRARLGTYRYYENGFDWTDYELNVDLLATDNDGIGVMFRYADANNYYKLDMDSERSFRRLYKVQEGVESVLWADTVPYTPNTWCNVAVRVMGGHIQVLVNDVEICNVTDSSPVTQGTVAMYCWGEQNAYFDNIRIGVYPTTEHRIYVLGQNGVGMYAPNAANLDLSLIDSAAFSGSDPAGLHVTDDWVYVADAGANALCAFPVTLVDMEGAANWSTTLTTVLDRGSPAPTTSIIDIPGGVKLTYNAASGGWAVGTSTVQYDFTTTATDAARLTLDIAYAAFHGWTSTVYSLEVTHNGAVVQVLPIGGDTYKNEFYNDVVLDLAAGDTYGIRVKGGNYSADTGVSGEIEVWGTADILGPETTTTAEDVRFSLPLDLSGPQSVAVSPAAPDDSEYDSFVYAVDPQHGALVVLGVDNEGSLSFIEAYTDESYAGNSLVDGLAGASQVLVNPQFHELYVLSPVEGTLAVFDQDTTTGKLTFRQTIADADRLLNADAMEISPDGSLIYVATDTGVAVFERDASSGTLHFSQTIGAVQLADGDTGIQNGLYYYDSSYVVNPFFPAYGSISSNVPSANYYYSGSPNLIYHDLMTDWVIFSLGAYRLYNQPGGDFNVYEERTPGEAAVDEFSDLAVYVSENGSTFYNVTSAWGPALNIPGQGDPSRFFARSYDISGTGLTSVRYIKLQGVDVPIYELNGGFDLDAIGAFVTLPSYTEGEDIWKDVGGRPGVYDAGIDQLVFDGGDGYQVYDGAAGMQTGLYYFDQDSSGGYTVGEEIWRDNTAGVPGVYDAGSDALIYASASGVGRPVDMAVSADGQVLYIVGPESITICRREPSGYRRTDTIPVSSPSDLAVSSDGRFLFVTDADDNSLCIFERDAQDGTYSLLQTFREGQAGLRGLRGANGVAVSPSGGTVYVTAGQSDALTVFRLNAVTDRFEFAQIICNGASTTLGLKSPNSVTVDPDPVSGRVFVGSSEGVGLGNGGVASFNVTGGETGATFAVSFSGIESLDLMTSGGDDTVRVVAPLTGVSDTTIDTGDGRDSVLLSRFAGTTTVNTGTGGDTVDIRPGVEYAALTVNTGDGADSITVAGTASGSTTTINAGNADDVIEVLGARMHPGTVSMSVNGDEDDVLGDTLRFIALGEGITQDSDVEPLDGSIAAVDQSGAALGSVQFHTTENVEIRTAPDAQTAGPYAISEGESIELSSAGTRDFGNAVSFAWDIDGDGVFGDSTVANPTLTWKQLCGFGLDDDGVYSIALRVTNDTGDPDLDSLYTDAFSTITINNTLPAVTPDGKPTTEVGQGYTVAFSATGDPGNDAVSAWTVNWQDGCIDTFGSDASGASHIYLATGDFNIEVTATDEDGDYTARMLVRVVAPQPDPGGPYEIYEGQTLQLHAVAPGSPSFAWDIDGDGTYGDRTGMKADLTWEDLVDSFSLSDNGLYTLSVRITYPVGDGAYNVRDASTTLIVMNAPPTAVFANDGPVDEGGLITVSFSGQSDPSPADADFTYSYDLNNDGVFELDRVDSSSASLNLTDSGSQIVCGRIWDKDDGYRDYRTVVVVREVAPRLHIYGTGSVGEGSPYTLSLSATDPGADTISQWRVNWHDGTASNIIDSPADIVSMTHTFPNDGVFPVLVTAIDEDGVYTTTHTVQVANVAPTIQADEAVVTVNEGTEARAHGTFGDLGNDPLTLTASIGFVLDNGDGTWTWSYVPSDGPEDSQTVKITVADDEGESAFAQFDVAVVDVAPSIELLVADEVNEGTMVALTIVPAVDPGDDVITSYTIVWSPGDAETIAAPAPLSNGFVPSLHAYHRYADDGAYTVTVIAEDDDGVQSAPAEKVLTVNNVAPVVTVDTTAVVIEEGSSASKSISTSDVATDTVSVTADVGVVSDSGNSWTWSYEGVDDLTTRQVTITATDEDGGTTTAVFDLMVRNVAPVVEAGDNQTVNEGQLVRFSGTFEDAGSADTHTVLWDFGDGNTVSGDLTPTHAYAANGTYTVTLTVTDDDGAATSDTLTLTVLNVAPVVEAGDGQTVNEGQLVSFSGSFIDAGSADTHTIAWDFGDGNTAAGSLRPTHAYTDNGTYTITLTVTDDDGAVGSDALTVTVLNVAPVVGTGGDQNANEGDLVEIAPTFTDAGSADTHRATIDWGDGTAVTEIDPAVSPLGASHTYADNGVYTVTVAVTDDDGASTVDTLTATIANMAPVVEAGDDQTVNEGQLVSFNGSFTDAGLADTHTIAWDFGDGSTGSGDLTPSHAYADNGIYTVTVTVTDDDGGVVTDTLAVTVDNVAPTLTLDPVTTIDENGVATLTGTIADPGMQDTFTLVVDWGDGFPETFSYAAGTTSFSETHQYLDDNPSGTPSDTYTINATLADDDGGSTVATGPVTVQNVPPVVDAGPDQAVKEGETAALAGSFTDAGSADTHSIAWDFGDGASATGVLDPTHVYADDGSYTVTLMVTDDDGGVATDTLTVTVSNVAPTVNAGLDRMVDEGDLVSLSGSFSDPGSTDTHICLWSVVASNGQTVADGTGTAFSFTPHDNGTYAVTFTVTDDDGGTNSDTLVVTANNVAPQLEAGPDETLLPSDEGLFNRLGIAFSDPGTDDWSGTVNFGDSTGDQALAVDQAGMTFDLDHVYTTEGAYTVTVALRDDDGGSQSDVFLVVVHLNTPPMADAGGPYTVDEGSTLTLDGAGSSDAQNDIVGWEWDLDNDGDYDDAVGQTTTFTWMDDGQYTVGLKVTDSYGESNTDTATVTVLNVAPAPEVTLISDPKVEGTTITVTGSAADPAGTNDLLTYTWAVMKDGAAFAGGSGVEMATFAFTPNDNGSYTITLTVNDEDGGSAWTSETVAVTNVAPTLEGTTFEVVENSADTTVVGTIAGADVGDDTLTYYIADGNGLSVFAIDSCTGTISVADAAQLDYETTRTFVLSVEARDDDGGVSERATVKIDLLNQASISGVVFVDTNENGLYDADELGIADVIIELQDAEGNAVLDEFGNPVTAATESDGFYLFEDLGPGRYWLHEVQPNGVQDGAELLGSLGGTIVADDTMQVTVQRDDATDYCFLEVGQQVTSGQTAGIGFWQNKHGQELIVQGGAALANWLTQEFGNVFGDTLAGREGDAVASFYKDQLFKQKGRKSVGPAKVDAQFMALALSTYFTSSSLVGDIAVEYGFTVSDTGVGASIVDVGECGAAFGVADGSCLTVMQLLTATNELTDQPDYLSGVAWIYDVDGDGEINYWEAGLRCLANELYSTINEQGGI